MPALVSGVTSMVRTMAPGHDDRWSDARIYRTIHMADLAICEAAEVEWASYVIELNDGEMYYTLPSDIISVRTVEYSFDGVTYEKVLTPATLEDLDRISIGWQDDTGSDPSLYVLLSAPGSGDNSQILVWRPVASTSGEKIRINYTKCRENVSSLASVTAPNDIMETVYLPYVLSILFTDEDMELANMYMGQFQRGLSRLKVRYNHRTQERVEALSDMGGY
jgi:hypothetical protein